MGDGLVWEEQPGALRRPVLVAGFDVVLPWAALRGAPYGGPALAAGLAIPGLLVVAPIAERLARSWRPLVPPETRGAVLVALQGVFALIVARQGASRGTVALSVLVAAGALATLIVAAGLVGGSRS